MQGSDYDQKSPHLNEGVRFTDGDYSDQQGRPLEILLTHEQFKQLQKLLPVNYSLGVSNKNTRLLYKKVASKDDLREESNAGNGSNQQRPKRKAYIDAEQTIKGNGDFLRKCEKILTLLKKHRSADPFLRPVDPVALRIPDYLTIIKEPMDLSTVEKKLSEGEYLTQAAFEADVNRIWANAFLYNLPNTQIYKMTEELSSYFEKLISDENPKSENLGHIKQQAAKVSKRVSDYESGSNARPKNNSSGSKALYDKPLTYLEKKTLSQLIRQLPSESLWDVWKIVSPDNQNHGNEELEFDIDTLPVKTARELEVFVRSKVAMINRKKNPQKKSGSTVELPHGNTHGATASGGDYKPDTPNGAPQTNYSTPQQPINEAPVDQTLQNQGHNNGRVHKDDESESSFISDLDESDY